MEILNNNYIDYEKILEDYNFNLINKLRDFNSKSLQFWVPEENITLSLANLFFSLSENNHIDFTIKILKKKINRKEEIIKKFKIFSDIKINNINNFYEIKISNLDKAKLNLFLNNYFKSQKNKKNYIKVKSKKKKISKRLNFKLKKMYFSSSKESRYLLKKNLFKEKLNLYNYFSEVDNCGLAINIKDGIIKDVLAFDDNSSNDKFILNEFCRTIIELPIFEAYEHGVIKTEHKLRKKNIKKKIKGIITVAAVSQVFNKCRSLISEVWKLYKKENNNTPAKNLYDLKPSKKWISLDRTNKISLINKHLLFFDKKNRLKNCLVFDHLNEDNIRLTISFKKKEGKLLDSNVLLNLEKYLKEKLDKRIEVFYQEMKDFNRLRAKNSPLKD